MSKSRLTVAIVAASLAVSAGSASAQNDPAKTAKAEAYFEKGESQYNLGNWDEAITLYKLAYEEVPIPDLLFNIAQAYRLWENCKQSVFFYKRYLANKPGATNRSEVEDFIRDQTSACKNKNKEPTSTIDPKGGEGGGDDDNDEEGDDDDDDDGSGSGDETVAQVGDEDDDGDDGGGAVSSAFEEDVPRLISARIGIGTAFVSFGDPMLNTDPLLAVALGVGYPLPVGPVSLELGGLATYTPVPWENASGMSGTASLTGFLANAGVVYAIPSIEGLNARGDLGAGVQFFGGLSDGGTPFLEPDERSDAALTMFHLRVAVGAEYMVTPNIAVSAFPVVFAYSPKGALRESISGVKRFELLFGLGYKM